MCFHFDFKEIFLYFYFFASEQKQTNKQTDKKNTILFLQRCIHDCFGSSKSSDQSVLSDPEASTQKRHIKLLNHKRRKCVPII